MQREWGVVKSNVLLLPPSFNEAESWRPRINITRKYVSIEELSSDSGMSVTQLRRLARAGRIPFFQPGGKGGKLLFPPDAIEKSMQTDPQPQTTAVPLAGRPPSWMNHKN